MYTFFKIFKIVQDLSINFWLSFKKNIRIFFIIRLILNQSSISLFLFEILNSIQNSILKSLRLKIWRINRRRRWHYFIIRISNNIDFIIFKIISIGCCLFLFFKILLLLISLITNKWLDILTWRGRNQIKLFPKSVIETSS